VSPILEPPGRNHPNDGRIVDLLGGIRDEQQKVLWKLQALLAE
jgi:tRNA nucleotidyltransferase/poly(A) polymerase